MSDVKCSSWKRLTKVTLRISWNAFALFGIGVAIYFTCFNVSRIVSPSMSPTLEGTSWDNGDVVLTEKISYRFRQPRRWEVIQIRKPDNTLIMKRVIGLPGETIQMPKRGQILINGEQLTLPASFSFLDYFPFGNLVEDKEFDCGQGYYVLGDDSRDSDDSRFNGAVLPENITGRAWLILAPSSRFGRANLSH